MAPGIIISITYIMAVGLTAISIVSEQKEGLLERSWVAGVRPFEVILSHVVCQFLVMFVQVAGLLGLHVHRVRDPVPGAPSCGWYCSRCSWATAA
uniref:Putative atp-binding cassette transporter n=1 Tax=Ixodes ricinus TaxID=34613 RepID=V5IDD3_IXORI